MIAGSEGLDRRVSCNMKCCCGGTDYTQMVNDDLKMIYYKIPRCASTSVEFFLSKYGFGKTKHVPKAMPGYFHFTFMRNPYSRVISLYRYVRNKTNRIIKGHLKRAGIDVMGLEFIDFMRLTSRISNHHWDSAYKFIPESGVDLIVKIDNMEGMDILIKRIGKKSKFPHVHKSHGTKRGPYYPVPMELIAERYADDFRLFGYPVEERV